MLLQNILLPTLLLSMISLASWSSPSGNLNWGKRFDKVFESVLVLIRAEWEVMYLPCAPGTWMHP